MIENPFMTIDEKIEDLEIKLEITNGIKSACKISFVCCSIDGVVLNHDNEREITRPVKIP